LIFIYGGGALGREVVYLLTKRIGNSISNLLIVDDFIQGNTGSVDNVPAKSFEKLRSQSELINQSKFIIAVGNPLHREFILNKIQLVRGKLTQVIDPQSIISESAQLADGVIVSWNCSISHNTFLEENVFVNCGSIIGHDVTIRKNSSISSLVNINGHTSVGTSTFIGSGAIIRDGVSIGNNVLIGAGSVVLNDVPDNVVVLGNPAKVIALNKNYNI
jgi:sugar O-acyltransferase (sialic acid O-acetyltransferase NeuD family)